MERELPKTGTSVEIDFYEDLLLDLDNTGEHIPAGIKEKHEERQKTISSIKKRYNLVSCEDDCNRTTLLVALGEPIFIRNLERDLRDTGIGILAVNYKSYLGRTNFFKRDFENLEEADKAERGIKKIYHKVLEGFASIGK